MNLMSPQGGIDAGEERVTSFSSREGDGAVLGYPGRDRPRSQ
jgi:hypothetical protein